MNASMIGLKQSVHRVPLIVLGLGLILAGCESLDAYEGPRQPRNELAQITGDTRLGGNLPITLIIRRVDELDLGLRYRGAFVLPDEHDLLIDCTVTESKQTSRHHLHVDVNAGETYRLTATTGPGNRSCAEVQLVAR